MTARRSLRRRGAAAGLAGAVLLLAGCSTTPAPIAATDTLPTVSVPSAHSGEMTIYASVELDGSDARPSLADAMQLALEQAGGRADGMPVRLVVFDETDPNGTTSAAIAAADARAAAGDSSAVAYIGDQTSSDTEIALPILNRAGILEVSPTASYTGLTTSSSVPGEPAIYYPTGRRTFARVIPNDLAQAAAQVSYEHTLGCSRVFVLHDASSYGDGLAAAVASDAKSAGLTIAGTRLISTSAGQYAALAASVALSADCVLYAGSAVPGVVTLFSALHAAGPELKLFGTDSLATSQFVSTFTSFQAVTYLTAPTLDPSLYGDAGQEFFESYAVRFGGPPDPDAIFAYEAMNAVLSAINTAKTTNRAAIVDAFFNINDRASPLGTYSIDGDGDTTLNRYGGYQVVDGGLQFDTVLPTTVTSSG
jgi:branched-chain amino acid transport system substrate-binding protein